MPVDPRSADAGPIQADLNVLMNELAHSLDAIFNGENCPPARKRTWFFLAAGTMAHGTDIPVTNRFNYISNADKLDIRATPHDVLARLEARFSAEGQA